MQSAGWDSRGRARRACHTQERRPTRVLGRRSTAGAMHRHSRLPKCRWARRCACAREAHDFPPGAFISPLSLPWPRPGQPADRQPDTRVPCSWHQRCTRYQTLLPSLTGTNRQAERARCRSMTAPGQWTEACYAPWRQHAGLLTHVLSGDGRQHILPSAPIWRLTTLMPRKKPRGRGNVNEKVSNSRTITPMGAIARGTRVSSPELRPPTPHVWRKLCHPRRHLRTA